MPAFEPEEDINQGRFYGRGLIGLYPPRVTLAPRISGALGGARD